MSSSYWGLRLDILEFCYPVSIPPCLGSHHHDFTSALGMGVLLKPVIVQNNRLRNKNENRLESMVHNLWI